MHRAAIRLCVLVITMLCLAPASVRAAVTHTDAGCVFTYRDAGAARVHLAGSFNGWGPNTNGAITNGAHPMVRDAEGVWAVTVPIDDAIIKYKFVTEDAQGRFNWNADPTVPMRDGDGNSVVVLAELGASAFTAAFHSPAADVSIAASGRIAVALKDANGGVRDILMLEPFTIDGVAQHGPGIIDALTITAAGDRGVSIEWRTPDGNPHALEASIQDNSRYYGGGERFHAINQKGYVLSMGSMDRPEDKGTCSYKPVPYIFSTRGYGLWLDSTSPSVFDLNATDRDHIRIGDTSSRMRLVILNGSTPQEALSAFTALTGRPAVPPAWAFAPWKSRNIHNNRAEVMEDVERSRKLDLPASVVVLDSPWETGYNDFILNEAQFPDPDAMFARVRALGFETCLWLTPFINEVNVTDMVGIDAGPSRNFAEAAEKGYLVKRPDGSPMVVGWWKGEGGLVDFTNPAAVAWWHDQMAPMTRWHVAAIKCDDGESNFVQDAVFHDASTAADMKGRYADLYLKASRDFLESVRPGDHTLIARCGFTGTGKYPFGWAGDNEASWSFDNGLPGVIIAAQTASLSGLPLWGCDIAGYIGDATPELFVRWTQFAAFTPLMMVHMTSNKGPWDYGSEALDIYRDFARLHTRLFPYIEAAAVEARDQGVPIIRPMVLAYPTEGALASERFQYMFGPDLLVAPMYHPGTKRSVVLPPGDWIDMWTGERIAGRQTIEVEVPLTRIPVYVRAGAVIVMLPDAIDTLMTRTEGVDPKVSALDGKRVIEVWPGADGSVSLPGGLRAETISNGATRTMTLTGPRADDIELRLRFAPEAITRKEGVDPVDSFVFVKNPNDSVIRIPAGDQTVRIAWTAK